MSLTERYVRADAAGGGDGTTDANSGAHGAFTLAEAFADFNNSRAGYRYNVKKGSYSTAGVTLTGDATPADGTIFEGFVDTPGDLRTQKRTNGTAPWDTTDWPVITFNQATRIDATGADFLIWRSIKFTVAGTGYSGPLLYMGASNILIRVVVVNPSTNANASGIYGGSVALDCDVFLTGATGCLYGISTCIRVVMCHIDIATNNTAVVGIRVAYNGIVALTRFVRCAGIPIDGISTTAAQQYTFLFNSLPQGATGVRVANVAHTGVMLFLGNLIANMTGYAFDSLYQASADLAAVFAYNRVRDNGATQRGFTDWYNATNTDEVSTDDTDANEFVNLGAQDIRLKSGSLAKGAGGAGSMDIGACQRAEPTLPAEGDVKKNVQYGDGGTELTGTYDPMAAAVFPSADAVLDSEGNYGPTGADYTPLYHAPEASEVISTAVFGPSSSISGTFVVPNVANVLLGVFYGAGGNEFEGEHECDLPVEEDVREGVQYDNGQAEGNLVLPAEEDVKASVQYGANGTELTGTLVAAMPWVGDRHGGLR